MASSVKLEGTCTPTDVQKDQAGPPDKTGESSCVDNAAPISSRKRCHKAAQGPIAAASRRSTRPRTAPKQYEEDEGTQRPESGRTKWKEEELERLLDCLKKYKHADNVRSVKKHVKTKNLEQVEAKIEYLRKKALGRALEETVGMPPLQCWETLAKDVTSTLSDETYKEISKVFWTATTEPSSSKSAKSDPSQPNYNEIYKFLAALLRGTPPPELSPIDSMVVLECLNNTVEFLQNLKKKDQTTFLQKRYEDVFYKLYTTDRDKSQTSKTDASRNSPSSSSSHPDHSDKPSTSGSSCAVQEAEKTKEPVGLGTLNPLNIPVDRLNMIRPDPCSQHGNPYCWVPACRERHKTQETSSSL